MARGGRNATGEERDVTSSDPGACHTPEPKELAKPRRITILAAI